MKYPCNPFKIKRLTEGGSERNFYRIFLDGKKSVIYMKYTDEKEENKFYYDIAGLLRKLGINVPDIYYKDDGNMFIEDLGDMHLYHLAISKPEKEIKNYYYRILDQLIILHQKGEFFYSKAAFKISDSFSYNLYRWESKYFLDNLIRGYFKIKIDPDILEPDFRFLADLLSKKKKVLIHRDCQSKNIIIKDEQPFFIDFQGMRLGLPQYDLASLLEDPYVNLSADFKDNLLNYYLKKTDNSSFIPPLLRKPRSLLRGCGGGTILPAGSNHSPFCGKVWTSTPLEGAGFIGIYRYCAVQRLMQALGAYSFLGLQKGKKEFLQYIPSGLEKLGIVLEKIDGLKSLKRFLNKVIRP